jgi:hypothetical protein
LDVWSGKLFTNKYSSWSVFDTGVVGRADVHGLFKTDPQRPGFPGTIEADVSLIGDNVVKLIN